MIRRIIRQETNVLLKILLSLDLKHLQLNKTFLFPLDKIKSTLHFLSERPPSYLSENRWILQSGRTKETPYVLYYYIY